MIEILSGAKSKQAIVTLAVGEVYEKNWKEFAFPSLTDYCRSHNIGLYLQNKNLDTQHVKKKITWQKLLLAHEIRKNFSYIEEFCYIDSDVIVNKFSPSIFSSNDGKLAMVSQFEELPFDLNMILRRIAFYRNRFISKKYPLDSSLFMSIEDIYNFHKLTPQKDYACAGFFMGNVTEHSLPMSEIFYSYDANVSTITDGGDEPILNFEFQNQFEINWLPYKFQALWLYEMAAYYPFLYESSTDNNLAVKCIESSLRNNVFLHFAGSWGESKMISHTQRIPFDKETSEDFYKYYRTPLSGKPVGRILPNIK